MTQQHVRLNEQRRTNCILIVEDDIAIGELLALALAYETPYQPRLVSSGQEALRTAQEVHPILLLLNYQLPDMTGIELYDALHARTEFAKTPAIVISANVPEDELRKRQLVDVAKPFDMDTLLSTIERVLAPSSEGGYR
jgi:DNA-binding response OmpR family regulator